MTEQEARTKWCFAAVASHTNPRSGFDGDKGPIIFPCIGSACMAWRWTTFSLSTGSMPSTTDGYCGLGGKP